MGSNKVMHVKHQAHLMAATSPGFDRYLIDVLADVRLSKLDQGPCSLMLAL